VPYPGLGQLEVLAYRSFFCLLWFSCYLLLLPAMFAGNEDLFSQNTAVSHSPADALLVAVNGRRINMAIPG
jgi:hypothetical protein